MNHYHILNGDALLQQFPTEIDGEIIICRECLVDGDVTGNTLDELFNSRARFISSYQDFTEADYFKKTVPEISKIKTIPKGSKIFLWFEDDLFCQVNFWFVCNLLATNKFSDNVSLVRPKIHNQFGFGGYSKEGLAELYEARTSLSSFSILQFAKCWKAFQNQDMEQLNILYSEIESDFQFLKETIQACEAMVLNNEPERIISTIIQEKNTKHFGTVFQEFSRNNPVYGFGDLQVKRIFDLTISKI